MYIQLIINLNQEVKRLGNKFIDNLKILNGVHRKNKRLLSQKNLLLAVFCIDRTAKPCYDYVRIPADWHKVCSCPK